MSEPLTITARRWAGGWELWHEGECWTQVSRLAAARQQVVDYLDTVEDGVDHSGLDVVVVPDVASLGIVRQAEQRAAEAARAAELAAAARREAARSLRAEGLSVEDTAAIMGVSRGRVSQLAAAH